jgi:preprotein translocase subunit SecF
MLNLIPKTNIDFIGKRYVFFAISGALILSGLASLVMKKGPKWGLDFTGGTLIEVQFKNPLKLEEVRNALNSKNAPSSEIQSVSGKNVFIIRTQSRKAAEAPQSAYGTTASSGTVAASTAAASAEKKQGDNEAREIQAALQQTFPDNPLTVLRREYVGPTVGKHLMRETALAFGLTFLGIIIYVAFRFHSGVWGAAGVIALVHDVFATIGIFSITDKEITVTIVAALLTIAGYSINDTIVIFDFMRERMRMRKAESFAETINQSLNLTLSRTIITNLTVFMVVSVLYFFGGDVIHDFAFAMVFGAIVGTYSSIAVAAPIIYEWQQRNGGNRPSVPASAAASSAKKKK